MVLAREKKPAAHAQNESQWHDGPGHETVIRRAVQPKSARVLYSLGDDGEIRRPFVNSWRAETGGVGV